MTDTIEYRPLPISTEDLLRLRGTVQERDRNLRLMLIHTEVGETLISVMTKGSTEPLFHVRHAKAETGKPCWLVHHPKDGPGYEFAAIVEVANFLAFGEARLCKRSWATGWSEPGRIVGGGRPPTTTTTTRSAGREEIATDMQGRRAWR
jgi:hypothetical protein